MIEDFKVGEAVTIKVPEFFYGEITRLWHGDYPCIQIRVKNDHEVEHDVLIPWSWVRKHTQEEIAAIEEKEDNEIKEMVKKIQDIEV